jgi:hypothetical protein
MERRRRSGGIIGRALGQRAPNGNGNGHFEPVDPWQVESDAEHAETQATETQASVPTQPLGPELTTPEYREAVAAERRADPAGDDEPPRRERPRIAGPLEAFLRHPIIAILPILLLAGGAVYLGIEREPEYTAEARVSVGRTDVPAYTLQNVVIGNQAIAASYARVVSTEPVSTRAGRDAGIGAGEARERLSATPVPGSTLIQVEATGPNERDAVALANSGAESLIRYVQRVERRGGSRQLLDDFRQAQTRVTRLERRVETLSRGEGARRRRAQVADARVDLEAARLAAQNAADRFRTNEGSSPASASLTFIAPAADASSDYRERLEQLILLGVAGGLVLGLGLALLRANRRALRSLRE